MRPGSSGESHFQRRGLARRVLAVPESPIFMLKTDQARSGAPHFKLKTAQARSGALANFSLCRSTYLPKFWVSTPLPPPPPREHSPQSLVQWTT